MKNWFIIQSHSSFENKVAQIIKEEAEKAKITEKIDEIIVPTHDITEVKRGKRVQRKKKYFPGYVLIKAEMDNNVYHMIKNIKKVSGFLGSKGMPAPVSDNEIEKIFQRGYRGAASKSKEGTGVGLFLARKLAKQIGGDLNLLENPLNYGDKEIQNLKKKDIFFLKLPTKELHI